MREWCMVRTGTYMSVTGEKLHTELPAWGGDLFGCYIHISGTKPLNAQCAAILQRSCYQRLQNGTGGISSRVQCGAQSAMGSKLPMAVATRRMARQVLFIAMRNAIRYSCSHVAHLHARSVGKRAVTTVESTKVNTTITMTAAAWQPTELQLPHNGSPAAPHHTPRAPMEGLLRPSARLHRSHALPHPTARGALRSPAQCPPLPSARPHAGTSTYATTL